MQIAALHHRRVLPICRRFRAPFAGGPMEIGSPMSPGAPRTPLLAQVERTRDLRRNMYGKLCRLGIMIRMFTFLNGLALLGSAGYSLYFYDAADIMNTTLTYEFRARLAIQSSLMALSGLFLLGLERATTSNEAATRSSFGFAFSAGGRFWLLTFC